MTDAVPDEYRRDDIQQKIDRRERDMKPGIVDQHLRDQPRDAGIAAREQVSGLHERIHAERIDG